MSAFLRKLSKSGSPGSSFQPNSPDSGPIRLRAVNHRTVLATAGAGKDFLMCSNGGSSI